MGIKNMFAAGQPKYDYEKKDDAICAVIAIVALIIGIAFVIAVATWGANQEALNTYVSAGSSTIEETVATLDTDMVFGAVFEDGADALTEMSDAVSDALNG